MVMTAMVIIPPPSPPVAAREIPTIGEVFPGRPRDNGCHGRVLAPGSGLERRADY